MGDEGLQIGSQQPKQEGQEIGNNYGTEGNKKINTGMIEGDTRETAEDIAENNKLATAAKDAAALL